MLNQMLDQAQVVSLLQEKTEPVDMEDRLAKLGPVLDKLKSLDPKTAGMLGKMMGMSFLQQDPDGEEEMMKLEGVMEKLKGLDPKTFGMLNGMLEKAQAGQSFMQVEKPDMEDRLMKLQPVLEKLHGLDPKTFGMLNQMLDQAQVVSLLQEKTEPMDME